MKLKALALLLPVCPAVASGAGCDRRQSDWVCMHDVFDDNRPVSQSDKHSARETFMKQLNGPTRVAGLRSFHNSVIAIAAIQVDS